MKNRFVQIVADYGKSDPAFNEVIQRIYSYIPDLTIRTTSVPAFDTIGTGFWIYQYALGPHPEGMVIYSNTAPRKDNKLAREKNEGVDQGSGNQQTFYCGHRRQVETQRVFRHRRCKKGRRGFRELRGH